MMQRKNKPTKRRKMLTLRNYLTKVNDNESATHYEHTEGVYYRLDNNRSRYDFWKVYCSLAKNRELLVSQKSSSSSTTSSEEDGFSSDEEIDAPLYGTDGKERLVNSREGTQGSGKERMVLSELVSPDENVPLRLTFMFDIDQDKFNKTEGSIYDVRLPLMLISIAQNAIRLNYAIRDKRQLVCCMFEKSKYQEGENIVISIKLQFPNLRTSYNTIKDKLVNSIVSEMKNKSEDILSNFSATPKDEWENIIATDDMQKHYSMYQCDDLTNPFILSGIHSEISYQDAIQQKECAVDRNDAFDIKKHKDYTQKLLGNDKEIYTKRELLHYMFYSKDYGGEVAVVNQINNQDRVINNRTFVNRPEDFLELKEIKVYLNMIRPDRINRKDSWLGIGKALYNFCVIYRKRGRPIIESTGLQMWMKMTKQSVVYKVEECRKLYKKFDREEKVTHNTIKWYARLDNPANYEEFKIKKFNRAIKESIKPLGRQYEEAVALTVLLDMDYACTAGARSVVWYEYNRHKWTKLGRISELRNFVSTTYTGYLKTTRFSYNDRRKDPEVTDAKKTKYGGYIKKLDKMIRDAGDFDRKTKLVKHISDVMNIPNMEELFDTDWNIMGVRNGILEIGDSGILFREGKPEDYVLRQSRVKHKRYTWKSRKVKWVMKWFNQMNPKKENMDYFGKSLSINFEGGNRPKKATFIVGPTGGGKSALVTFMSRIFEGYESTLPESQITVTHNDDKKGPDPYLAAAINSNIAWIHELMGIIDPKKFKMLTGKDFILARFLGENGTKTSRKPRFKLISTSNFLPIFQNSDSSIIDRVIILMMHSRWIENAPKSEEEQMKQRKFPRDNNFEDKFDSNISAGLWVLMQYYNRYRKEGLDMPKDIKKTIETYWREKDVMGSFIKDCVMKAPNTKTLLRLDVVERKYRAWIERHYPSMDPLDKNILLVTLKERFSSYEWSEYNGDGWPGLKLRGFNFP